MTVAFVHVGSPRHGVTRYGLLIDDAVSQKIDARRHRLGDLDSIGPDLSEILSVGAPPVVIHLQYSDSLFGDRTDDLAVVLAARPAQHRVVVTVHDVPGIGGNDIAVEVSRWGLYQRIIDLADCVVVSSAHERRAVEHLGGRAPLVIPHLVEARPLASATASDSSSPPIVGVLGYIYPGKGHELVIDACAQLDRRVEVAFLGCASDGHDWLVESLRGRASEADVELRVSGWIEDAQLSAVLASVSVPVAAHRTTAASGSIATWHSAKRRPVVADNSYTQELNDREPGCVDIVSASGAQQLGRRIEQALDQPERTRLPTVPVAWSPSRVALEHLDVYRRLSPDT